MTPELHALTQAEKQIEILEQQNAELHEAHAAYIWQLAHALGMAGEEVADAIVQPSLLVDAIVERDEKMRELRRQLDEANAHADAVRKQPRALLMCLDAELRVLATAMETLRRSARDHNELFAVRDIDDCMSRLSAWLQPEHKNGGGNHG